MHDIHQRYALGARLAVSVRHVARVIVTWLLVAEFVLGVADYLDSDHMRASFRRPARRGIQGTTADVAR